nr:PIN domain-containing protein [Azospirillum sp. SYSU D00513]
MNDAERQVRALEIISALPESETTIPVQVMGEVLRALLAKGKWQRREPCDAVGSWRLVYHVQDTTDAVLTGAMDLIERHGFQVWDAIILAASAEAGCGLLLSEDMQDGFSWRGVTIANPFIDPVHPLLAAVLAKAS